MIAAGGSIAILVLTLAIAGADAPVPAATPSDLPEIGRTKATTPACAAMRDLVIPSFEAARRADARFVDAQKRLLRYAEARVDVKNDRNQTGTDNQIQEVSQEALLSQLDQDAASLLAHAAVINKALGDPRLPADSKDPDVREERAQLQALYAAQQARASMLAELASRDRVTLTQRQMAELDMTGKNAKAAVHEGPPPQPFQTPPPGMPLLSRNGFADKQSLGVWTRDMATAVADAENRAAKSFLPIAQRCR
jgi:hypothetical protein